MTRILVLSDLHVPLHHEDAVEEVLKRIRTWHPGVVVLLGDVLDSYSISRFMKNPNGPKFQEELDATKEILSKIRSATGRGRLEYLAGNHEDRLRQLLWEIPALNGLKALDLPSLLDFPENRFLPYEKDTYLKIENIAFYHGGEIRKNNETTAKYRLLSADSQVICIGHTHKMSVTYIRDRAGLGVSVETGCLSDPKKAEYLKTRKLWDLGWVEIVTDSGYKLPKIQPIFL